MTSTSESHDVVIVGGGTAGITVAARLRRAGRALRVAVIEPSARHFYQPLWTLVGGGVVGRESTVRPEASVIPRGVEWIRDFVETFQPDEHTVVLRSGRRLSYGQLVVAAGIQMDWGKVRGLPGALGHDGVCSNYSYDAVEATWRELRAFQGGTALFTMPNTPVRCGGAPQKILYLAEDYLRRHGLRGKAKVIFATAGKSIFGVPYYRKALEKIVADRGIEMLLRHNLVEVRGAEREAVFEHLDTHEQRVVPYDLLHVTPPMSAPDFLKSSPLADADGWVDTDPHTLQHKRWPDIFALGDVANLPTSKTGAAIRKQAPVLVKNLLAHRRGAPPAARYNGYTSCPIITGYGRLMLAEFDYDDQPQETFPFDQRKERFSMWLLKKYLLPVLYWHGMLKGRA
ncbi:MAG TPA: pyridine nucleotide-disulfide oxidoreductase [Verrucomicrobiales bacterium]|nr:pyridine nucleotide-disulfide oxidoreductase [Verrucomicrobiales bacterium]